MTRRVGCFAGRLLALALLGTLCLAPNWALADVMIEKQPTAGLKIGKAMAEKDAAKDKVVAKDKDAAKKDSASKDATKKSAKDKTAKDAAKAKAEAKPATYKVKKSPFRIEVDLEGVFEPQKTHEMSLRTKEWSMLSVLTAVEHGATVEQGDLLLSLDTEKIDRAIADQEKDLQLAELSLKQADQALVAAEKLNPLDLESAKRAHRNLHEDLKQYTEVERVAMKKIADFTLQMAKDQLEYQEEELNQLEKMYHGGDVTEETEKIVLKRARDQVKLLKFKVELAKINTDAQLKLALPRQDERVNEAAKRAEIEWNRTKIILPINLGKLRLEMAREKHQHAEAKERLHKLMEDRAAMTNIKSPCNGIVYYGQFTRGKWAAAGTERLRRDSAIAPHQVFMTVVQTRPLVVRFTVPEAKLQNVFGGLKAVVEPAVCSDLRLSGIVEKVSPVPTGPGSFDAQIAVALDSQAEAVMPGMSCQIKMVPYQKKDALTVPAKAVFWDNLDPQKHVVYLAAKKGAKPEKREVTVGKRNDKQVEIVSGLSVGDEVLLDRPKDELF